VCFSLAPLRWPGSSREVHTFNELVLKQASFHHFALKSM
jgi:hypothetical protein